MPTLNFYDKPVEYDGKPLGMLLPNGKNLLATFVPSYATMDPAQLQQLSERQGREEFVEGVKQHLAWVRLEREGYNPFLPLGDQNDPVYIQGLKKIPEEQKTGLANSEAFLREVLSALSGE